MITIDTDWATAITSAAAQSAGGTRSCALPVHFSVRRPSTGMRRSAFLRNCRAARTVALLKSVCAWAALFAALLYATPAWAKDPPSRAVEKTVEERTGVALRWQQDATAREEALAQVRAILKKPLTVKGAVQIALLNNRDLLATFEDIGVSAADLREAGLWKNPSISLALRWPDRPPSAVDAEESAVFDFLDLLMLPLRKRVAADHLAATQLRVADEALRLVAEVKSEVYWLEAGETIMAHEKTTVDINATALDLAQRQHAAGNITDLALARQQAAYNDVRLALAATENEQREHREKLNRLLSLWGADVAWKLAPGLPPLPAGDVPLRGLESLAVAQRLDLAAAQAELAGVVRALGLTKSYRYLGALEFGVDTEHNPDRSNVTGPTFRLELPLFNQGQARVAKSEAELRRAERKVEALAIGLRADVRALHDKLVALRETVTFYERDIVPNRQAITAGTLLQYNGMLVGNYELFSSRAEQMEAEQKSTTALRDYWLARTALERAVGGNLHPKQSQRTANTTGK